MCLSLAPAGARGIALAGAGNRRRRFVWFDARVSCVGLSRLPPGTERRERAAMLGVCHGQGIVGIPAGSSRIYSRSSYNHSSVVLFLATFPSSLRP